MKILHRNRTLALGTLAAFGALTFAGFSAKPAQADSDTWKKAAIGAGAVAVYGLIKGDSKLATIGGVAAAGAYAKYKDEKKDERYDYRYDNNYRYPTNNGQYDYRYGSNNRYPTSSGQYDYRYGSNTRYPNYNTGNRYPTYRR